MREQETPRSREEQSIETKKQYSPEVEEVMDAVMEVIHAQWKQFDLRQQEGENPHYMDIMMHLSKNAHASKFDDFLDSLEDNSMLLPHIKELFEYGEHTNPAHREVIKNALEEFLRSNRMMH